MRRVGVLDAWPVHGACGVWGCLAAGIFAQHRNIERAYGGEPAYEPAYAAEGKQLGVQCLGVLCIIGWTSALCLLLFLALQHTVGMRATDKPVGWDWVHPDYSVSPPQREVFP
eukprot:gene11682-64537_t